MVSLLVACSPKPSDGTVVGVDIPAIFRAVPSDALALVSGPNAADVLSYFDSTSALHDIPLGTLAESRAVLSVSYYTSLVPVLTIEAGRVDREMASEVSRLQACADSLGFNTAVRSLTDGSRRAFRVLTICPSATVLKTVLRHIDEGVSIADVPLFERACATVKSGSDCLIFRPDAAARLLPPSFMAGLFPRAAAVDFVSSTAAWLTLSGHDGSFAVEAVSEKDGRSFADFLDMLEPAQSRVNGILPPSPRFVLDFPVASIGNFRSAIDKYRDANITMDSYRRTLRELHRSTGKNPLDWEKELNVREIAVVVTDSLSVLLVRPSRRPHALDVCANAYRGFMATLYGSAFKIDDSCMTTYGRWLVFGASQDVQRFVSEGNHGKKGIEEYRMMCWTRHWKLTVTDGCNKIDFK